MSSLNLDGSDEKDPHNTIERLTNSLEILATSEGSARVRYEGAWGLLVPLREEDFPLEEDRARFRAVFAASPDKVPDSQLGARMKAIWELYWRMTSNELYT
jgi:hypothetical protein